MKNDQNLPNKSIHSNNSSERTIQIFQMIQENSHFVTLVVEADHQNKEIREFSHKIDVVDQIVKIISKDTTIHDPIQTDENRHFSNNRSRNSSYK